MAELMPHGELQSLAEDAWWLQGTVRMGPGVVINRNMVVLRHEGELSLVSAIRLDEAGLTALEALGRVAHVVKIGTHGMDDGFYLERYGAEMWALDGAAKKRRTKTLGVDPFPAPWVSVFAFELPTYPEGALLLDRGGGVLVTCDSLQSWPDFERCSAMARALTVGFGFSRHTVVIGPPWKRMVTPKGGTLEPDYRRLLELDFDTLISGHGKPLQGAKPHVRDCVDRSF